MRHDFLPQVVMRVVWFTNIYSKMTFPDHWSAILFQPETLIIKIKHILKLKYTLKHLFSQFKFSIFGGKIAFFLHTQPDYALHFTRLNYIYEVGNNKEMVLETWHNGYVISAEICIPYLAVQIVPTP